MPDLNKYLVHLLIASDKVDSTIRSSAGLLLKNNLRADQDNSVIKESVIPALMDNTLLVRNIAGTVVSTLYVSGQWPEVIDGLLELSSQGHEGPMAALAKICEDSPNTVPVSSTVPKLLALAEKFPALVVGSINQFVDANIPEMLSFLDQFLELLFSLANSKTGQGQNERIKMSQSFVSILNWVPEKLIIHLEGIVAFALKCIMLSYDENESDNDNEQVSREGCEFILAVAESNVTEVQPLISQIVPVILKTMVYSESDRIMLMDINNNEDVEDRPEDIRPNMVKTNNAHQKLSNLDEEEDPDEADALEELSEWNLRKCSAAALDVFATKFPEEVLQSALPHLREGIVSQEWYIREASILAFGAISLGCFDLVQPHLPELIPFLVSTLSDANAPVRQIACWTLTRYSSWIAYNSAGGLNHELYLQPALEGILGCSLDKSKQVQEAACSALATLTEDVGEEMAPYLEVILKQLALCFEKYKSKNLYHLYDSIQTLIDRVGPVAADPIYAEIIVPPLMNKWASMDDTDKNLWPLFSCVSTVAATFGKNFGPYVQEVFSRGVRVLKANLEMDDAAFAMLTGGLVDHEFEVTALDMLDGIVQGVGADVVPLLQSVDFVPLLLTSISTEIEDVAQSALALLGDVALYAHPFLPTHPQLEQIILSALEQMDLSKGPAVINNSIWASGELALKMGPGIQPYAEALLQRYDNALKNSTDPSVLENSAIAIGRLGHAVPSLLAQSYPSLISAWSLAIMNVFETDEKDSACVGMCMALKLNPAGIPSMEDLVLIVLVLANYVEPSDQLRELVRDVLGTFRELVGNEWGKVLEMAGSEAVVSVSGRYGLA